MVEQTGGLSKDAKLHAQAELANWTGDTDSEDEGHDDDQDEMQLEETTGVVSYPKIPKLAIFIMCTPWL